MSHYKDIVKRERNACAAWRQFAAVIGLAAFSLCMGAFAQTATAGPRGENVAAGDVDINRHGNTTRITASDGAIIEWREGFDIPANESVRFLQPGSWASVLNKDYSNNATTIDGKLFANGTVMIANPYGIYIGGSARLNVGHLIAAAGNISNEDFLAGSLKFDGLDGNVINSGRIQADGVALLGRQVANHGQIVGANESVLLVSGDEVWLGEHGNPIRIGLGPLDLATPAVENTGVIRANRGNVRLAAGDMLGLAVRNTGSIRAAQIEITNTGGDIHVAGVLDASSHARVGQGGSISVVGERIALLDARLDASGGTGGGEILIGADRGGESIIADAVPIPRASAVVIDANTTIHADARKDGNGGKVIVWGDDMARVHGEISVQGGKNGGDGGFVETSSHGILDLPRAPLLRAPAGEKAGQWLIDPANVVIKESTSPDIEPVSDTEFYTVFEPASDLPDPSVVDAGAVVDALAVGGNVTVTTEVSGSVGDALGTISVESPLVIPNDPDLQSIAVLQLLAADTITIQEEIINQDEDLTLALIFVANDNFLMVDAPGLIGIVGGQNEAGEQDSKKNPNFQLGDLLIQDSIDTGAAGGPMIFGGVNISLEDGATLNSEGSNIILVGTNPVTDPDQQEPLGSISIAGELRTHGGIASLRSDDTIELVSGSLLDTGGGIVELISPIAEISAPIDTGGGTLLVVDSTQITLNAELKTQGGDLAFLAAGGAIDIQGPITTEGGSISISSSAVEDSEGDLEGGAITLSGPGNVIDSQLLVSEEVADEDIGGPITLIADSDISVGASIRSGGGAIKFVGLGEFTSTEPVDAIRETVGTQGQLIAGVLEIKSAQSSNIGAGLSGETLNISVATSNDGTLTFSNSPTLRSVQTDVDGLDTSVQGTWLQAGAGNGNLATVDALTGTPRFEGAAPTDNPVRFSINQDADISDSALPNADQFGAGNVAGLEYRLQSIGITIAGDPPIPQTTGFISLETPEKFAGSQLQLGTGAGAEIAAGTTLDLQSFTLAVADSFAITPQFAEGLASPTIGVVSGQNLDVEPNVVLSTGDLASGSIALSAGASSSGGNLNFGENVRLVADGIALSAGFGQTQDSQVNLATGNGATAFQRNTDSALGEYSFSLIQDANLEDALIPVAASFRDASGTVLSSLAGVDYTLLSQTGRVSINSPSKVNDTRLSAVGKDGVELASAITIQSLDIGSTQNFEVTEALISQIRFTDPTESSLTLEAGSSGSGNLSFGESSSGGGITIAAEKIQLLAGGPAAFGTSEIVFDDNRLPTFTGANGNQTSPKVFLFRQSRSVFLDNLPDAARFGDGIGPTDIFAIQSDGGNLELGNPNTVAGTGRLVASAPTVIFAAEDEDLDMGTRSVEIQSTRLELTALNSSELGSMPVVDASRILQISGFSSESLDPDSPPDIPSSKFVIQQSGTVTGAGLPTHESWQGGAGPDGVSYTLNSTQSEIDLGATGDAARVEGSRLFLQVDSAEHGIRLGTGFQVQSLNASAAGDYPVNPDPGNALEVKAEDYILMVAGCANASTPGLCDGQGNLVLEQNITLRAPIIDLQAGAAIDYGGLVLSSTDFVDANSGWAVGSAGFVLHTDDGGVSWLIQDSPVATQLSDVAFVDNDTGWAVGEEGVILLTLDGGKQWSSVESGTTRELYGVSFSGADEGWAVGDSGTILKTTNGGQSWTDQKSGTGQLLNATDFIDNDTGWVVGSQGTILTTRDGGLNWTQQDSGTNQDLVDVTFENVSTGWAVGTTGTILTTSNGGASWTTQEATAASNLSSLSFVNNETGWVVGEFNPNLGTGTILNTADAGINWGLQNSATGNNLFGVDFTNDQSGWAVGDGGTILHTSDGGAGWDHQGIGGIVQVHHDPSIQFEIVSSTQSPETSFNISQVGDAISANLPIASQFGGNGSQALADVGSYALRVLEGSARITEIGNLKAAVLDIWAPTIEIVGESLGETELSNTLLQAQSISLEATSADGQVLADVDTLQLLGLSADQNPNSFSLTQQPSINPTGSVKNLPSQSQFSQVVNGMEYFVTSKSGDVIVDFPYFAPRVVSSSLRLQAGQDHSVILRTSLSVNSLFVNTDSSVSNANLVLASAPTSVGQITIPTVSSITDQYYASPIVLEQDAELQAGGSIVFISTVDAAQEGLQSLKAGAGGAVQFGGDIGATGRLGTFEAGQASGINNQPILVFGNANTTDPVAVRTVDDILLLPEGYTGGVPDTATIFKPSGVDGASGADEYDLLFDTLEGDFIMGEREKLSLPGILSIRAGGTDAAAQIGDLSGLEIYVEADNIELLRRQAGWVLHSSGTVGTDSGVDYVANIIEFNGNISNAGSGNKPVFGLPNPFAFPAFFNNTNRYPTAALNANNSPATPAIFTSTKSFSVLDLQPLGASTADLAQAFWTPAPRPREPYPPLVLVSDPAALLEIGIAALPTTSAQYQTRLAGAGVFDDINSGVRLASSPVWVSEARLLPSESQDALMAYQRVLGPERVNAPRIREILQASLDQYRSVTGARRVVGFEFRRYIMNRPSSQFAAYQALQELDSLFRNQRTSGLAPSEFSHIQNPWLKEILPEGITADELSQTIFPSRYVRGSDILDVFGE